MELEWWIFNSRKNTKCGEGGNGAWVFGQSEPGPERRKTQEGIWAWKGGGIKEDMTQGDSCDVHAKTEKQRWNRLEKERLWGASNSESLWDDPGPAVVPPPLTVTATDSIRHRTAASNTTSATSSTRRRVVKTVMTWTVCIGVRVCDEWSLARFVEYYLLSSTRVYVNGMQ